MRSVSEGTRGSLRTAALLGLLMGCVRANPASGASPPGGQVPLFHCTDPRGCTQTNGTGVYFAERGAAGIGIEQLLITHFMSDAMGVRFQARYREPATNLWRFLSELGRVWTADYDGQTGLAVLGVGEVGTVPTWILRRGSEPPLFVHDQDLLKLVLHIQFGTAGGLRNYVIDFNGQIVDRPLVGQRQPTQYAMRWGDTAPIHPYCEDAQQVPDTAVFQQGIDVHPLTGAVARGTASFVTLSCSLGAPATVYKWGYDYVGSATFYFDAGIHMKRASYCGDEAFYTRAGTPIEISDDVPINGHGRTPAALEAWWTPTGAMCVNKNNLRQPGMGFSMTCNGTTLPSCTAVPRTQPLPQFLVDGPQR